MELHPHIIRKRWDHAERCTKKPSGDLGEKVKRKVDGLKVKKSTTGEGVI